MASEICDCRCYMENRFYNVVILGISFMLIFAAFQATSMTQKAVLDSVKNESENGNGTVFKGDGYISLSILYLAFAVSNWVAPTIVVLIGPKISMFCGAFLYFLFVLSFLKPMTWALYEASALVGFGGALLWNGHGHFMAINSDSETISRNSVLFWVPLQCSLLLGNLYSYFVLESSSTITHDERTVLFAGLSGAGLLGTLLLLLLRNRGVSDSDLNLNSSGQIHVDSSGRFLMRSLCLMLTKEMLLVSVAIAYTGVELTFFSGVYGTCISNTKHFSDAKGLIGISGMFIGAGEIIGGTLFGLLGKMTMRYGRQMIVMFGYMVHIIAFILIYLNLPANSPIDPSEEATYMTSSRFVAILCSFLLGLGDSSFNTQIYALLGSMFPEESSPAFAIFKFVQSVMASAAFYYSGYLILKWQLLILVVLGTAGLLSFTVVFKWISDLKREVYYDSI